MFMEKISKYGRREVGIYRFTVAVVTMWCCLAGGAREASREHRVWRCPEGFLRPAVPQPSKGPRAPVCKHPVSKDQVPFQLVELDIPGPEF